MTATARRQRERDDRGEGRELPESDEGGDNDIHEYERRASHEAGTAFAENDRQRSIPFARVERHLVYMLPGQDGHHPQSVSNRREECRARNLAGDHGVAAAHHEWPPTRNTASSPRPMLFNGIGAAS
jgi:hypothetical protein